MSITSICLVIIGIVVVCYSVPYKNKWWGVSPKKAIIGWAVIFFVGIMIMLSSTLFS